MKALFNNNLIDTPLPVMPDNRAFQFGDGIFETIWFRNGKVPLIEFHRQRILRTSKLLRLKVSNVDIRFLDENIETLRDLNLPDEKDVIAKIMFWRHASERAGYWADFKTTDSLLVVRSVTQQDRQLDIDSCETVRIARYPWSTSKNLNALPYIMASMECRDRKLDELVIFNQEGAVAEGISSNLFIHTKEGWKTPALTSGCVAGTMRAFVLSNAPKWKMEINEESLGPDDLLSAESMLMTRATGIDVVGRFGGRKLATAPAEELKGHIMAQMNNS
ncbi:MAG: aminotransferase class IV [Cyclobacteriaceae bacterium]